MFAALLVATAADASLRRYLAGKAVDDGIQRPPTSGH